MKKLIIAAILVLPFVANSQALSLKENGFVDSKDSTKNYVVIEQPKIKQAELYKKTLTYLNGYYKNPSNVLSTVDGESITVNASDNSISGTKGIYRYPFDYNIVLQFKDGKIKFQPSIGDINEADRFGKNRFYIKNTDSPQAVEVRCIYMKEKKTAGYWLFQDEIKIKFDSWVSNYIADLQKALQDNW